MADMNEEIFIEGPVGKLAIQAQDKLAKKMGMLFEVKCLGKSPQKVAKKYGYTKQRYYQLLDAYQHDGVDGIMNKKPGPKNRISD